MFKGLQRQPWICAQCLARRQTRQGRRSLMGLASAAAQPERYPPPSAVASHATSDADRDDRTLRKIFDSPAFWKDFSTRQTQQLTGERTGLLTNKYLTSPAGFEQFSADALKKCQRIVDAVLSASSQEDYKSLVRQLDRLSDQLCRVIDLVEFIRNVHPDPRIQAGATQAHSLMYEYMNILNTNTGLDEQLKKILSMPEITSQWTEEERITARILAEDFAQSAISAPAKIREKFVDLSNDIVRLGKEVMEDMMPAKTSVSFNTSQLNGMDPVAVKSLTKWGVTTIPTYGRFAVSGLRNIRDADVRKELYTAYRSSSKRSIDSVEMLVRKRAELARLSGHESFGHMTLSGKMAKTPEAVSEFLGALAADNRGHVHKDLAELAALKEIETGSKDPIQAWDREYYADKLRTRLDANTRPSEVISSFFSLGSVMQGLSRLFSQLYGIRLVPRATRPGEAWNPDVRRLDVIDENEGHIAVLYCDLFQRPNKSPNPAHFTLRCSREITASEIAEAAPILPPNPNLEDLSQALNDGMALNYRPADGSLHQLPTVAFICDFPAPNASRSPHDETPPTLLSFRQLETLYHEMGHALHSILGRTRLQNVAGTRCATDFAELPSVLMEHFAASPEVLSLYARHWRTDDPLNVDLIADELARNRRLIAAAETEAQILLSVLDQRLHSASVPPAASKNDTDRWNSTSVYEATFNDPTFSSVPEPKGTSWQGFFGHLFGYGAVYYSYLLDRAIAGKLWASLFQGGPPGQFAEAKSLPGRVLGSSRSRVLDREAGQRYRDEVLRWGGGRDGWACVAGALGSEYTWMREGGSAAMREVGRWGVGDKET